MANPKQVASGGLFVQLPSLFYFFKLNIKTLSEGLIYSSELSLDSAFFNCECWRRALVNWDDCGRAKKYDKDSSEVVRSTVLTFTPRRAVSGAGAKFKTAFTPAVVI